MGKLKGGAGGGASRKELRKAHRQAAKQKKQQRHLLKQGSSAVQGSNGASAPAPPAGKSGKGGKRRVGHTGSQRNGGGAGASAPRRKRWRSEEIDPMIAAEDAELKRLERLLGVTGPNAKKKLAKLEREIEVEDGMGDDFGAFLADLDRIADVVDGGGGSGSSDNDKALMEANGDFHENVPEDVSVEGSEAAVAQEGPDDEDEDEDEDEDFDLGDGGREVLEGVAESEGDLLETIEEAEEAEVDEEDDSDADKEGGEECTSLEGAVGDDGDSEDSSQEEREEEDQRGDSVYHDDDDDDDVEEEGGGKEELKPRSDVDTAGYGDEDDGYDNGGRDAGAQEEQEQESEDFKRHTYQPKPGQDIYGRPIEAGKGTAAPAAYVPPHLRAAAAAAAAEKEGAGAVGKFGGGAKGAEVQRVVNGIMNRLSEETLEPVTARLREAYTGHSTTEANQALWQATRAVCVHDKQVMTTLIPSFTAVIAALNISLGADVGGFFLETIAKELNAEVWGDSSEGSDSARRRGRGTGSNLVLLLAYLYNYGVAHCTLVYDIIGLLVDAFGADEMELLLLLLRYSGYQLRSDDPEALKQIVALVKEKFTAATADSAAGADVDANTAVVTGANGGSSSSSGNSSRAEEADRWKAAFGARASSSSSSSPGDDDDGSPNAVVGGSRARYILDTILELQSNKRSRIQEQGQESGRRVRKWLGSIKAAKGGGAGGSGGGDASLRVTWAELVSTESKGRWWRVGAAWAGRVGPSSSSAVPSSSLKPGKGGAAVVSAAAGAWGSVGGGGDANGNAGGGESGGLLALAARQRMNTDVRRSVFVAIVGSSDCEDALEKILRLNLKGAQEREIARVIVECCSQEGSYNPFYAHLAERVCDRQPKLRFTFQVAFWDALKTLDDGAARRAGSLARLMAHLVVRKQLSLTVLKTVEVEDLSPSGLLLMRVFFHEIIAAGDDASFMEVFRRLARPAGAKEGRGHSAARDNALVFLRGHLGPAPSSWDRDRRKAFRKRDKKASEFATRDYTIHLSKRLYGVTFKKRAPRAVREVKKFAQQMMKTSDVRVDAKLNKFLFSKGVRNVPTRVRVRLSRKRNEDEEATEKLYTLVQHVEVASIKGLQTENYDQA
eukprot:g13855.t1